MSDQPEALQTPLPDLLDKVPNDLVLGIPDNNRVFPSHTNIPIGKLAQQAAAELRRLHDEIEQLKAERDALLDALRHAAEIAHNGGLQAMTEWDALVAVRQLTLPYFVKSGGLTETHDRLRAAIDAARGKT